MTTKEIILSYYQAWSEKDKSRLRLADDLKYIYEGTVIEGKDNYVNPNWPPPDSLNVKIVNILTEGNVGAVLYNTSGKIMCEWFRLEDQLIKEIQLFEYFSH